MILDSYTVIALLRDEPAASEVEELVAAGSGARLTALGVAEVVDRLVRLGAVDPEEAVLDLAQLGLAEPVALEPSTALRSGLLRAARYHRTSCAVSIADCVAAETARHLGTELVTADPHLLEMCAKEAIPTVVLPDSRGKRWRPNH